MTDLADLSIAALAEAFRDGAATPLTATEACLQRIAEREPQLNAWITVCQESALAEARSLTKELAAGHSRGPLHGVPIGIKDLYATAGVRTTAGSKVLADWVPDADATVVRRLREAGAVILGKLGMYEFAYGASSLNQHYGRVPNPVDLTRTAGGSSSGSGAAVAAGMCYGALGSDTGGSIRCPASFCGIVGLKPTYGRVSRAGAVPLAWSLDHVGPMTRTVTDTALMLSVMGGHDPADRTTSRREVPDYAALSEGDVSGLRLAMPDCWLWADVDAPVQIACLDAVERLRSRGVEVKMVPLPALRWAVGAQNLILQAEATAYHRRRLYEQPQNYGNDIRMRLADGLFISGADYLDAQRARRVVLRELQECLRTFDALVCPSVPKLPPTFAEIEGRPGFPYVQNTFPFNLTGLPAISVPCGTVQGLPVGLQIIGKPWDEGSVLKLAQAVENDLQRPRAPR